MRVTFSLVLFPLISLAAVGEFGNHFQGDIILDSVARNGITNTRSLWPQATIVYAIENTFTPMERQLVLNAMYFLSRVSCIQYKPRTNENGFLWFRVSFLSEFHKPKYIDD